jgi:Ca2+-binding EF-hand superfamily protein
MNTLKEVSESIIKKQLEMRQIIQLLDVNKTGFLNRTELAQILRTLCDQFTLDQARLVGAYFDERDSGKISVNDLTSTL